MYVGTKRIQVKTAAVKLMCQTESATNDYTKAPIIVNTAIALVPGTIGMHPQHF